MRFNFLHYVCTCDHLKLKNLKYALRAWPKQHLNESFDCRGYYNVLETGLEILYQDIFLLVGTKKK